MRVGILGGGQLGRMLALAGHPLGVTCTVLDPADDCCASQVCAHIRGEFEGDYAALYELVRASDVITYEFENVPVETARWLAERLPVYPPPQALEVCQDRVAEKRFLQSLGIPTPPFAAVETRAEFDAALADIGLPAVLKTRRFGYDGKGQAVVRTPADAEAAWERLSGRPLILEGFVPFDRELSLIAVRDAAGDICTYPLIENWHVEGVLHRSVAPAAGVTDDLYELAVTSAERLLTALNYVGVLTVEWFQHGPRLLVNELAPRVHNSGHWTIEAAETSQFENHLRAVCGYPLGSAAATRHAVLYNFLGTVPPVASVLSEPNAHLHRYGKADRPGRKVGHVTICDAVPPDLTRLDAEFTRGG